MTDKQYLELSQMLLQHPVLKEKPSLKIVYLNVLEYFVRKYSEDDLWANAVLDLYVEKFLDGENYDHYNEENNQKNLKKILSTRFKPFCFYTLRYCLLIDCIFMNAYENPDVGMRILNELEVNCNKRHQKRLQMVCDFLYGNTKVIDDICNIEYMKTCWDKNRQFLMQKPIKVMVTANMSAGKSTLLNAIIGKKVNKTQNDACTSKIHYIVNKAFEDGYCYESDYILNLHADYETLMEDNSNNTDNSIVVGTHFRSFESAAKRLWLIDTPGVNSAQDIKHRQVTEQSIETADADLLIYLMNGENIGSEDDKRHLLFVKNGFHKKILFVVNKVDRFRKGEDSVMETLEKVKEELQDTGFEDPVVVPVSAYAGYLAKILLFGESLNEDEIDEVDRLKRKLKKDEYQFNTYYPEGFFNQKTNTADDTNFELLLHSGLLHLENMIYNLR